MLEAAARLGFHPAATDELPQARAIASQMMSHDVASEATLGRVLQLQPASTLFLREAGAVSGMVSTLLLRPAAEAVLRLGAFDGLTPDEALLARGGDAASLYYVWGIAGATKSARAAVMDLMHRFRFGVLADLTAYAVAATRVGRYVGVTQLGFAPVRHPDDNLLVSPPQAGRIAA
jgi:hypothetical protein